MFQIIKPILISHKDNRSKYKMQFLNDDVIYLGKQIQTYLALCEKVIVQCPQSVRALKLKCSWVMQQDNDPKHTSKSTSEWFKKTKLRFWSGPVKVWT